MNIDLKQLAADIKEQISETHYRLTNGVVISNEVTLEHIKSLGIDPNGAEVLQCPKYHETEFYNKFAESIVRKVLNIADEVDTGSNNPEWLICERLGINHDWRKQDNFWK